MDSPVSGQARTPVNVLVLSQYYPPDSAVTGLHAAAVAARLAKEGRTVTALVSAPSYTANGPGAQRRELLDGVQVERIGMGRARGRETLFRRLAGYARYLVGAWWASRPRPPQLVLAFHNPPLLGVLGRQVARRSGARFVYVEEDIHPDILVATDTFRLPRVLVRVWDALEKGVVRGADAVVVLGDGMKETLVTRKGVEHARVVVIPPWAEPELEPRPQDEEWRRRQGLGEELVVLCAGNMGLMQPLELVLEAAGRLTEVPVSFVLAGSGVRRKALEQAALEGYLRNVHFLGHQPVAEFARMVAAADVGVVALRPGMERLSVPSRAFGLMAAGRPILALMEPEADIARWVDECGAGWKVRDAEELTSTLRRLAADRKLAAAAGAAARAAYKQSFDREAITGRYEQLVASVLAGP